MSEISFELFNAVAQQGGSLKLAVAGHFFQLFFQVRDHLLDLFFSSAASGVANTASFSSNAPLSIISNDHQGRAEAHQNWSEWIARSSISRAFPGSFESRTALIASSVSSHCILWISLSGSSQRAKGTFFSRSFSISAQVEGRGSTLSTCGNFSGSSEMRTVGTDSRERSSINARSIPGRWWPKVSPSIPVKRYSFFCNRSPSTSKKSFPVPSWPERIL